MNNIDLIKSYIPIANYIQSLNCGNSEVLLHNLEKPESSVLYIAGNVTNRKIGDPLTKYAVDILDQKLYESSDYISGYMARTNDGKIIMRSSTMFIRNGSVAPIGLMCVNIDVTKLVHTCEVMDDFIGFAKSTLTLETIHPSPETAVDEVIQQMQVDFGVKAEKFSKKQKLEAVRRIEENGLFRLKGIVHAVAQKLYASEKTVYRYMNELENEKGSDE